jgi:hypothetical protein
MINDGNGIDIAQKDGIWIPELVFGHLRTSTNYNKDEKKIVGGKNGFGFKLVLIWSKTTQLWVLLCLISTRVGYDFELVVIGAITIVCKYLFISFGEMITHGRVFFISFPWVGSKLTKTI